MGVRSAPGLRARANDFFITFTVASLIPFLCCAPIGTKVQLVVQFFLTTSSQSTLLTGNSLLAISTPAATSWLPLSDTIDDGRPFLHTNSVCLQRKSAVEYPGVASKQTALVALQE